MSNDYDDQDDEGAPIIPLRGKRLKQLVEMGIQARDARFGKFARELEVYDNTDEVPWEINWDSELSMYTKVHKTSQYKREVGSRLFNERPEFRVSAQPWSDEIAQIRSQIMEAELNYSASENDLTDNVEMCMLDALGAGRGVVWHGLHPEKDGVVTSVWDTWKTLVLDPDPRRISQINWCARIRRKSRRWLLKNYKDKKASILAMDAGTDYIDPKNDKERQDTGADLVTFYEVWMKVGIHHYMDTDERDVATEDGEEAPERVDEPKKYVIGSDGTLLYEGEWETPFHIDGRWPFDVLDFIPHAESVWPDSPLRPGLPWLRALNMLATVMLAKYRLLDGRTIIAIAQNAGLKLSDDDVQALVYSDKPVDLIQPVINSMDGEIDIKKFIQTITLESNLGTDMEVFRFVSDMFEKETGLHEFLFVGQPSVQDRSAAATQVRDRNSQTRIDNMRAKMENFLHRMARAQGMVARYHLDAEDIRPILGPEAAQLWGEIMTVEDMDPNTWAARYAEQGISMDLAQELAQQTVGNGVSLEDWAREVDYTIEVGSMVRKSPEAEIEVLDNVIQQVVPLLVQNGAFIGAGVFLARAAQMAGASDEDVQAIRSGMASVAQQQMMMQQQAAAAQQPPMPQGAPV